ncbi:type II toxin-antitoxin system PemK/MazF family toxin [Roseateles chitinivorans]|uniref:type II toxin-antitoxin system PemK/MazF family toxin n=1 Tax=Roseateles chitinivorans TaxID=2917965 RepID=UPI00117C7F94
MYWTPRPKSGDIVQCRFPERVGVPGPKERPALVLQVEEAVDEPKGSVVVVAYATSRRTNMLFPGEFVVEPSAKTGLVKPTKFDLVNRHALPFDDEWFAPAPGNRPTTLVEGAWTSRMKHCAVGFRRRFRRPSERPRGCPEKELVHASPTPTPVPAAVAGRPGRRPVGPSLCVLAPMPSYRGVMPAEEPAMHRVGSFLGCPERPVALVWNARRFNPWEFRAAAGARERALFRESPASLPNPPDVFRQPLPRDLRTTLPRQSMTSQ